MSHVAASAAASAAHPAAVAHLRVRHAYSAHTAVTATVTIWAIRRTVGSAPPRPAA